MSPNVATRDDYVDSYGSIWLDALVYSTASCGYMWGSMKSLVTGWDKLNIGCELLNGFFKMMSNDTYKVVCVRWYGIVLKKEY